MINFNINITASKLLAYLILLIGSAYGYLYQDTAVLIATFSAAGTVMGIKTYTEHRNKKRKNGDGPEI